MWILQNIKGTDATHYLPCGLTITVARTGNLHHIILQGDKSISREHASFTIIHDEQHLSNPEKIPEVIIQDLSSTYGTYLNSGIENKVKLPSQVPQTLKQGDLIRFGLLKNVWKLHYVPLVVTTSMISDKEKLKETLCSLGGHCLKEWTKKCSLLIMNDLMLTAKTVCALASGSHIVTPNYLYDMLSAVKNKQVMPDPKKYLPPLKETSIDADSSFLPNSQRKTLLSGKTFLFQTRNSLKRMNMAVTLAGGICVELTEDNVSLVTADNNMMIKSPERDIKPLPSFVTRAYDLLRHKGLNSIPESDIGLAILYTSLERNCNPNFNITDILRPMRQSQAEKTQQFKVYATETQETEPYQFPDKNFIPSVPPSRTTIVESGQSTATSGVTKSLPTGMNNLQNELPRGALSSNQGCSSSTTSSNTYLSQFTVEGRIKKSPSNKADSSVMEGTSNKENFGKRKRINSSSEGEVILLPNKRQVSESCKGRLERDNVVIENTKPLCENKEMEETVPDSSVGSPFVPNCFSTQISPPDPKEKKVCNYKVNDGDANANNTFASPVPPKKICIVPPLPNSPDNTLDSIDESSRIPKSIPFDPYTLPSLAIDDMHNDDPSSDVPQINVVAIKNEPQSQNIEAEEEIITTWVTKKCNNAVQAQQKQEFELVCPSDVIKRERVTGNNNNTEFALPFTSQRKRRGRGSSFENSNIEDSKRPKIEQPKENESTTIKRSISDYERESTRQIEVAADNKSNIQPFISKELDETKKTNTTTADAISELGEAVEKSLVIVEIVSLVKVPRTTSSASSTQNNVLINGLPNFKKFKKVSHLNSFINGPSTSNESSSSARLSLPRIIGGHDLISHTDVNSRKDDFLSSQINVLRDFERREAERTQTDVNDGFDSAFNINVQRRGRRARVR